MRVSYRKEVLVSTAQYENTRICVGLEDDVRAADVKKTYARLRESVHDQLVEEIVDMKIGEQMARRSAVTEEVRKRYRL